MENIIKLNVETMTEEEKNNPFRYYSEERRVSN